MTRSICLSEELPASPSPSPDLEKDWTTRVATFAWSISDLLRGFVLAGYSGKTYQAYSQAPKERILGHSFQDSPAGISLCRRNGETQGLLTAPQVPTEWLGECLTLSTLEFLSAAVASSLSDILETGDVPQRFFLSATACQGILRRAEKIGKKLPQQLHEALLAVTTQAKTEQEEGLS